MMVVMHPTLFQISFFICLRIACGASVGQQLPVSQITTSLASAAHSGKVAFFRHGVRTDDPRIEAVTNYFQGTHEHPDPLKVYPAKLNPKLLSQFSQQTRRKFYRDQMNRRQDFAVPFTRVSTNTQQRSYFQRFHDPEIHETWTYQRIIKSTDNILTNIASFQPQNIVASPFDRTVATGIMLAANVGVKHLNVILDPRMGEPKGAVLKCARNVHGDEFKNFLELAEKHDSLKFASMEYFQEKFDLFAKRYGIETVTFEYHKSIVDFDHAGQAKIQDMQKAATEWTEYAAEMNQDLIVVSHDAVVKSINDYLQHGHNDGNFCRQTKVDEVGFVMYDAKKEINQPPRVAWLYQQYALNNDDERKIHEWLLPHYPIPEPQTVVLPF